MWREKFARGSLVVTSESLTTHEITCLLGLEPDQMHERCGHGVAAGLLHICNLYGPHADAVIVRHVGTTAGTMGQVSMYASLLSSLCCVVNRPAASRVPCGIKMVIHSARREMLVLK